MESKQQIEKPQDETKQQMEKHQDETKQQIEEKERRVAAVEEQKENGEQLSLQRGTTLSGLKKCEGKKMKTMQSAEDLTAVVDEADCNKTNISKGNSGNKAEKIEPKCLPLLPAGKDYHMYFLYRTLSSDRDWVINVIKQLENDGFKCGFHERDFIPGQTVISNITDSLRKSLKVVLVISPDFLQSEWTKYETELATLLSLEQSPTRLSLIPVLLRHCEIPDCLKNLTYLDAQGEEDKWWPKLKKAITFGKSSFPLFSCIIT